MHSSTGISKQMANKGLSKELCRILLQKFPKGCVRGYQSPAEPTETGNGCSGVTLKAGRCSGYKALEA